MKIADLNKPDAVTYVSKKQDEDPKCVICGKLKVRHSNEQKQRCYQAEVAKA